MSGTPLSINNSLPALVVNQAQVTNLVPDLANKQPLDADLTALGARASATSTAVYPQTDKGPTLGRSANRWKRLYLAGTTPTGSDFSLSSGWGSTASVGSITGDDNHWRMTITVGGMGIGADPTVTYTYKDGDWGNAPWAQASLQATSDGTVTAPWLTWTTTGTTLTVTFHGTPVTGKTYTIEAHSVGG